jgi:uncharacterized protein YcbX
MRVAELWRFPVKSMRGEQLVAAELTEDGIRGDRVVQIHGQRGLLTAPAVTTKGVRSVRAPKPAKA